jgi:hypothetical protein
VKAASLQTCVRMNRENPIVGLLAVDF